MADETVGSAVWLRVGDLIHRRRVHLGMTQRDAAAAADVSATTWNLLELGKQTSYRPLTLRAVERTLGWPDEFIDNVIKTGEPPALHVVPADDDGPTVDFNSRIARLSPEDQRYVDELVERLLRERDE